MHGSHSWKMPTPTPVMQEATKHGCEATTHGCQLSTLLYNMKNTMHESHCAYYQLHKNSKRCESSSQDDCDLTPDAHRWASCEYWARWSYYICLSLDVLFPRSIRATRPTVRICSENHLAQTRCSPNDEHLEVHATESFNH